MTLDQANSHNSWAVPANESRTHAEMLIKYVLKASSKPCKCVQFAGNKDDVPHRAAQLFQGDPPLMNIRVHKCS